MSSSNRSLRVRKPMKSFNSEVEDQDQDDYYDNQQSNRSYTNHYYKHRNIHQLQPHQTHLHQNAKILLKFINSANQKSRNKQPQTDQYHAQDLSISINTGKKSIKKTNDCKTIKKKTYYQINKEKQKKRQQGLSEAKKMKDEGEEKQFVQIDKNKGFGWKQMMEAARISTLNLSSKPKDEAITKNLKFHKEHFDAELQKIVSTIRKDKIAELIAEISKQPFPQSIAKFSKNFHPSSTFLSTNSSPNQNINPKNITKQSFLRVENQRQHQAQTTASVPGILSQKAKPSKSSNNISELFFIDKENKREQIHVIEESLGNKKPKSDLRKLFKRSNYHVAIAYHIHLKQFFAKGGKIGEPNLDPVYSAHKLKEVMK